MINCTTHNCIRQTGFKIIKQVLVCRPTLISPSNVKISVAQFEAILKCRSFILVLDD